nr:ATP-dependent helicase BRM-like [Coffea arabica]
MQSGGGGAQQGSGHGRSAAVSPASSSSGVSTSQLGLDQQQQQQQQQQRQSLQQQFLRRPEGNDPILAYQAGSIHGVMGGGNFAVPSGSMQLPQQPRKFMDLGQQQIPSSGREEGQGRSQAFEQHLLNPVHHAYYAFQAAQQKSPLGMQPQQQMKMGMFSPPSKDQEMRMANMKMQELISAQAANQPSASSSKKSVEHVTRGGETQGDHAKQHLPDQRADSESPNQPKLLGQAVPVKPMPAPQSQQNFQNMANNPNVMAAQMQALALERNIDLSNPANANLIAQFLMQSRMISQQKANESNAVVQASSLHVQKQPVNSPTVANESSPRGNTSSDASAQSGSVKARYPSSSASPSSAPSAAVVGNSSNVPLQQFSLHGRDSQLPPRQPNTIANGMPPMPPSNSPLNLKQGLDNALLAKGAQIGPETLQMQYGRQPNRSSSQSMASSNDGILGNTSTSQDGTGAKMQQQNLGFTKQQLHVLKAQILAFRRLKKGDGSLPRELLQAIAPPPLEMQMQQMLLPAGALNPERSAVKNVEEHERQFQLGDKATQQATNGDGRHRLKDEAAGDESATAPAVNVQSLAVPVKEPTPMVSVRKEEQQTTGSSGKSEPEVERANQKFPIRNEFAAERGKAVTSQAAIPDTAPAKKPVQGNVTQPKDVGSTRKYHGPLFDFPVFTRKHDSFGSSLMMNNNNNLTLAYDIKDLLAEEGMEIFRKKREENIRKIGDILAVNLERKRIRPDLVLRLQIEEKKLQLADVQARLRDEIEQQQQDIMAMPERPYRKFVRLCERQRQELARQVQASQKALREKQLKSIFQWRKKLLEAHWAIRDARTARNRGVAKYHERMLREFSKRKDDDRNKRMEALKNNDVERYREMLLEQQTSIPGDAAERYAVLSSFLSQTEEYLHRLGGKITAAKNQQEVDRGTAMLLGTLPARLSGLSEEEVRSAAACAREEVMIRNRFSEMNAPRDSSSVNKYYNLAHAVNERVIRQPSMLRAGTLRDYQLVGLQWMLSLYNNKLNGILADEMGLGKTVQVMSLIAYLMEFKGNYGPHLIVVPNAVLVNWKSELHNWLPNVSCIYYVGGKDQRSKLFSQEVSAMKFNVLVTTYEFIMYDRSKLSKVDWKYIIIDEAQRMKDRESVLARDLDRYRCQRRLLLTGTPLQFLPHHIFILYLCVWSFPCLQCKNVISRLRKRIDREGAQIIPLLTDLWKRIESSGCTSGAEDNLFDLPEIDMRLDNQEYRGVMEFVSDVQLMLRSAVQYYGYSYEVRSEARKVHDLFFDILKIVFPENDFREAKNSLSFTSAASGSAHGSSSKQVLTGQNRRQKATSSAEPEPSRPQKPQPRGPIHEDTKTRGHVSQKEARLGSSSSRDLGQQDDSRPFAHPGELVICKKKRKDREKLGFKAGNGSAGPVSPTGVSRGIRSPAQASIAKDVKQVTQQQGWNSQSPQQVHSSGGNVGWANPVKRMRTDAGKRRPSLN